MTSFYHGFDTLHLNWFTGCERGLPCWDRCWARALANRLKGRYGYPAAEPFRPTFHEEAFNRPLPKQPSVIALNFMGDWALASQRDEFWPMLDKIRCAPQHTFLTLTKRPVMLGSNVDGGDLPDNLWLGMSTFGKVDRAAWDALNSIPAAHYWLSYEPLLEAPELPLPLPHWVVAGCESGRGARWGKWLCGRNGLCTPLRERCAGSGCANYPAEQIDERTNEPHLEVLDWLRSLRDQCAAAGTPFMCKQVPVFKGGKWLVSNYIEDFPPDLQCQERPR